MFLDQCIHVDTLTYMYHACVCGLRSHLDDHVLFTLNILYSGYFLRGCNFHIFFAVEWDLQKISPRKFVTHADMHAVLQTVVSVKCCSSYSMKTPRVHSLSQFSLLLSVPSLVRGSPLLLVRAVHAADGASIKT